MTEIPINQARSNLLACLQAALQAVNGRDCVRDYCRASPWLQSKPLAMVAIGKAALSMAEGAIDVCGQQLSRGLVITKAGYAGPGFVSHPEVKIMESGHPLPDERSLLAGQVLIQFLQDLPDDMPLLFLISGGSSALVEVLPDGMDLADLQRINSYMLAAGMSIHAMNRVRQAISLIKGGRLLRFVGDRPVMNLLLSDVPGDDPAVIGSGLLIPTSQPSDIFATLPDEIRSLLQSQPDDQNTEYRARVRTAIVGDNQMACAAAAKCARDKAYAVTVYDGYLTADVKEVADQIMTQFNAAAPGIYIWGGEPTVCLPEKPGRGGRNQHLALLLARRIRQTENIHILVAATDGSDGPGDDAGALVDGYTVQRGEQEGFDVENCLQAANAGAFLEASGDLISTGPTGSNVMDLIIVCKT